MTHFWAKTDTDGHPGLSVHAHMINVGCVALCIAKNAPGLLIRFQLTPAEIAALAALHDLGKISPGFQRKCPLWLARHGLEHVSRNGCWDTVMESDHGKVSHSTIQTFLLAQGIDQRSAKFLSAVLGGHHGRLSPPNARGFRPQKLMTETASHIDWDSERMNNASMVWNHFGGSTLPAPLDDDAPSLWWLAGLTSVADWIGSDERFFPPDRSLTVEEAMSSASTATQTIGLLRPLLKTGLSFTDLFDFPPNDMQRKTLAAITAPGVYVIEAPMGLGKTEAALGAAYNLMSTGHANGIYFALPTQATSNRMHLRMNDFLKRIAPGQEASRLIHANSWLMAKQDGLIPTQSAPETSASEDARTGRDWFTSTKRALLAPFGVGTIDQALLGAVAAKHFFVRHFALAGKVVILDEIHSYDLYTGTLIDKLISTLEGLGCTVIVLSATLTGRRRWQIVTAADNAPDDIVQPYPLITGRSDGETLTPVAAKPPEAKTVEVEFVDEENAAAEAVRLALAGGVVLWICNTIEAAEQRYRRLTGSSRQKFPVGLLHSRFPFRRREELETEWMERLGKNSTTRCGSILVATQVVEQSVDLDADLLVTELAPTDMLLQRLGRLWRHERRWRPIAVARAIILSETKGLAEFRAMSAEGIRDALGGKALVYDPLILLRSLEAWRDLREIHIPAQIRQLLESTYGERENEPESWLNLFCECEGKAMAHRQKALMSSNLWNVPLPDEEGVQTRINEVQTVSLVLCRALSGKGIVFLDRSECFPREKEYRLATAQAIHRNLVKVPRYCFDHVHPFAAFSDYLHGEHCAGIIGEGAVVAVEGLQQGIRLLYTDEAGLILEKKNAKERT